MRGSLFGSAVGAMMMTMLLAPAARAQGRGASCAPPAGISPDSLRAAVARLHPEALAPERRAQSVVVGLLYDAECRLTHHALSRRAGDHLTVDTTLARLFPAAYVPGRFVVAGIAEAEEQRQPGSPWIVWAVVRAPGTVR